MCNTLPVFLCSYGFIKCILDIITQQLYSLVAHTEWAVPLFIKAIPKQPPMPTVGTQKCFHIIS